MPAPRTKPKPPGAPIPIAAYSVSSFCQANGGMSEAMFFKMLAAGEAPDTMLVGRRRMISIEAAEAWRRKREAAAQESSKTEKTSEIA